MEIIEKPCHIQRDTEVTHRVIEEIFSRRRLLPGEDEKECAFDLETEPHYQKIMRTIGQRQPIMMVLPAFPAKSPSRRKTLSHLPDYGEELALSNLSGLCDRIARFYDPGAKVVICSDGRVFADIVHIPDRDVTAYNKALRELAQDMYGEHIEFFDLDDVYHSLSDYAALREDLMILYGEALSVLKEKCHNRPEAAAMYRGITKFLFEDFCGLERFTDLSRTVVQGMARTAAYRVIQRSNAWSRLLADRFPDAVRLSIHPQFRVSEKIGINLIDAADRWSTPWHSVILKSGDRVSLVPRAEAEQMNATLIFKNSRPSYFQL